MEILRIRVGPGVYQVWDHRGSMETIRRGRFGPGRPAGLSSVLLKRYRAKGAFSPQAPAGPPGARPGDWH